MKSIVLLPVLAAAIAPSWTAIVQTQLPAASTCAACETLLKTLQHLAQQGQSTLQSALTDVCISSKIEDPDVCTGLIASQVPAAHYVLTRLGLKSHTSQTFCASVLRVCPSPVRLSNLALPPPPSCPSQSTPSNTPPPLSPPNTTTTTTTTVQTIRIAHLTDTHLDPLYTPGSNANCSKPICCRPYTPRDSPGNTSWPCSPWGDAHCDTPLPLLTSALRAISSLNPPPALTIYAGDAIPHDIWSESRASVLSTLNTTYAAFRTLNHPVYSAIGNHDTHPLNIFPGGVATDIPDELSPEWVYAALAGHWRDLMPSPSPPISKARYATTFPPQPLYPSPELSNTTNNPPKHNTNSTSNNPLKIMSYNSILYYSLNLLLYTTPMPRDPLGQFSWLIAELHAAELHAQKVLLITHIPPAHEDTIPEYAQVLETILGRFRDTVVGVWAGHSHWDEFRVGYFFNSSSGVVRDRGVVSYLCPSLTPTSGLPAFRVYDVVPGTWEVLDFTVYVGVVPGEMDSMPFQGEQQPHWTKYYTAQEAYSSLIHNHNHHNNNNPPPPPPPARNPTLTPRFWGQLVDVLARNATAFGEYWARRTRGVRVAGCEGACVRREICRVRGGDVWGGC
ncbi:Metallo-dependent phosphatase [Aspergillus ellipticus CBS 707.79]|uniref:Metallo-dependent phosphatase n=1 Tax=Aspergillus ellipticus CBS 707.79 TaxID=1448320 RepID=A0A319EUY5_9EURO|nr:Metallo-dependent phosphatase [Aspergillus ellipticus CBS 707.79]